MSERERAALDLEATWRNRLDEQVRCGQSVREWCARQGVTADRFYYWKRRLRASVLTGVSTGSSPKKPFGPFARVEVASPPVRSGISIRMGQASIELEPDFDPEMLRRVVGALEPRLERC